MIKKELITFIFGFIILSGFFTIIYFYKPSITGMAIITHTGNDFANGSYQNTEYNGTGIILADNNLTGTYISEIIDCGSSAGATWNNLAWQNEYAKEELTNNQATNLMEDNILLLHMNDVALSDTPVEDSADNNDGSPSDDAHIITGKLNNAGDFDGAGDRINAGNNNNLNLQETITISAWINLDTKKPAHGYHHSIADRSGDNQNGYWFYVANNAKLGFLAMTSNDYDAVATSAEIPIGEWVHVTATYNKSDAKQVKLYINGQLDTHNTLSKQIGSSSNNLIIGDRGSLHYLDGSIDELAIYNKVLSEAEVSNLYNEGNGYEHTGNEEGLVSVWHMNEDSWKNSIEDTSGQENDLEAGGNPLFQQQGKLNYSIEFDGDGDIFTKDHNINLNNYTISTWIKTSEKATQGIFELTEDSTNEREVLWLTNNGYPGMMYNGISYKLSSIDVADGEWHHILAKYNGEPEIYIDGQEVSLGDELSGGSALYTNKLYIGKINVLNDYYFKGHIDELALWNRSLSPQEIQEVYKKGALKLNLSARSCDDASCSGESWQQSGTNSPMELSLPNNRYFQYKADFETEQSISPLLTSVDIDYTILNTAPSLSLIKPQDGATYGYNESLPLNYSVADNDNNLDTCWYNLGEENITLPECQNTTFNVQGDGTYTLTIYSNDTHGELVQDHASFSIQIGAPTITLESPINTYLSSQNVVFIYTPEDIDLASCELWGNFSGNWEKQQSQQAISGQENNFTQTIQDGLYQWNIQCNDTQGNSASNGNQTFYIDTISPVITLTEPTGSKSSRTNIPLKFTLQEANPDTCWYSINWQTGGIVKSNTTIPCQNTTFDVSTDGSYFLEFWINDSASHLSNSNTTFSVDTSSTPSSNTGSSSGGSGGGSSGGGGGIANHIEIKEIGDIIIMSGNKKTIQVSVENTGFKTLNKCQLIANKEWITCSQQENIAAGEIIDYIVDINLPKDIEQTNSSITIKCNEENKTIPLNLMIIEPEIEININKIDVKDNQLTINYSIKSNKQTSLIFEIIDANNNTITKQEKQISSGKAFTINKEDFDISDASEGMLKISIKKEDGSILTEEFFLYNSKVTGFAGLGLSNASYIGAIIIVFLIIAIPLVIRIIRHHKK
ncbi:MAG: LamG domain-containing protein [Candidatus Nanoarchaeia archaeon]